MSELARTLKPAGVRTLTVVCRPRIARSGLFALAIMVEETGGFRQFMGTPEFRAPARLTWCGSRSLLGFDAGTHRYTTSLRLPKNVSPDDCYVLTLEWEEALFVSAAVHGDETGEWFDVEAAPGEAPAVHCADPSAYSDRSWRDVLVAGQCGISANNAAPLCALRSLRAFPDGGAFAVTFRHPGGAAQPLPLQVLVTVAEVTRLVIIPANVASAQAAFRLSPNAAGVEWPLTIHAGKSIEWSSYVERGFENLFPPAFSLIDS